MEQCPDKTIPHIQEKSLPVSPAEAHSLLELLQVQEVVHASLVVLFGHLVLHVLILAIPDEVLDLWRQRILGQMLVCLFHGYIGVQTHCPVMLLPE